jgi:hypothetical protein
MKAWRQIQEEKSPGDPDAAQARRGEDAEQSVKQARDLCVRTYGQLETVVGELELLASDDVLRTAKDLEVAATDLVPDGLPISPDFPLGLLVDPAIARRDMDYGQARTAFVEAARRELAVTGDD